MVTHRAFYLKQRILPVFGVLLVCSLFILPTSLVSAASTAAISQSFQTHGPSSDTVAGALVSTSSSNSQTVELANQQSANRTAGIISTTALVALSGSTDSVNVVISGTTSALVSDMNGSIHTGDKITASPINGVGMLATNDTQVVGIARTDFNVTSATARAIQDRNGQTHTVHIGQIPVQVNVSYYQAPTSKFLPPFLQNLANGIAGRPVPIARILFSGILLILAFSSIIILIYSSARAGIISLGRNPLAANAINKGLVEMGLTALLIVAFGLVATYLILTF